MVVRWGTLVFSEDLLLLDRFHFFAQEPLSVSGFKITPRNAVALKQAMVS